MIGISENFKNLALEELRFEVALFQAISMSNYANEMKSIAKNKGTRIINKVSGLVNGKGVEEVPVITVEELVIQKNDELKYATEEELQDLMLQVLKEKLVENGIELAKLNSDEKVLQYAVKEGVLGLSSGIGEDASLAQKADDIAEKFAKKQIKELKGNISGTKMNRDLFAHFIWKISVHNKAYFPAAFADAEGEILQDQELRALMLEKSNYDSKKREIERTITSTDNKIIGNKANIADLEEKLTFVDKRIADFVDKNEEYTADAESAKRVKSLTEKELSHKKDDLAFQEAKLKQLYLDIDSLEDDKNRKEQREEELNKSLVDLVKNKWCDLLPDLVIASSALEHLIKMYSFKERQVLESALQELSLYAGSTVTAGEVNNEGKNIFSFVIGSKAVGRIIYENNGGIIEVLDVFKIKRC